MPVSLKRLSLRGYKTIHSLEGFEPRRLTVLIGPNGAGKSNFISFFRLLSWMVNPPGHLQDFIRQQGGAHALLHGDANDADLEISANIELESEKGIHEYEFVLAYQAPQFLAFSRERYRYSSKGRPPRLIWTDLGPWQTQEARLVEKALEHGENSSQKTAAMIHGMLRRLIVYQFHNTSWTARIRGSHFSPDDGRYLREDAANLASFLFGLARQRPEYLIRIENNIRLVLPFFAHFVLEPEGEQIVLRWAERGTDKIFHAGQAADGMLRLFSLMALLLQPEENLPALLILDEPELGLHPHAIDAVAGLIQAVSLHSQVLIATQSATLLNRFEPEDVVVVDRRGQESTFRRLDSKSLAEWLSRYSLAELVEMNVLSGAME